MVLNNTNKLCIVLFILGALVYVLKNNKSDNEQNYDNIEENLGDQTEYFDHALDNVVKENSPSAPCNKVKKIKSKPDHIQNWENEFKYKDDDQQDVSPQGVNENTHGEFTSDGINYYNNLTHFDSTDLLPNPDADNKQNIADDKGWTYKHGANWDESNPQIAQVEGNAWLNERKFLGISSVGSTNRNATHDIRRDIPNPQMVVSPWNNTTILPDSNSKGLCSL